MILAGFWLVPALGLLTTVWMATQFSAGAYLRGLVVLVLGAALYAIKVFARKDG